jgi:hypothetical protein
MCSLHAVVGLMVVIISTLVLLVPWYLAQYLGNPEFLSSFKGLAPVFQIQIPKAARTIMELSMKAYEVACPSL